MVGGASRVKGLSWARSKPVTPSFLGSFFWRKEVFSPPRASSPCGEWGVGASGLAARLVLSGKSVNRPVPRRLSSRLCGILPAFSSVLPKPDHHRPRPTTRTRRLYHLVIDGMDVRVVGCPRQDHQRFNDWLGGRCGNNPHLSHTAGAGAVGYGIVPPLVGGGRAYAPTPPLCAAPFPPPLGAARLRTPACGGIFVFRCRDRPTCAFPRPTQRSVVGTAGGPHDKSLALDMLVAARSAGVLGAPGCAPSNRTRWCSIFARIVV